MNNLPEIFFDTETSGLKTMFDQAYSYSKKIYWRSV